VAGNGFSALCNPESTALQAYTMIGCLIIRRASRGLQAVHSGGITPPKPTVGGGEGG